MADNFQSSKVIANELLSSAKFDNFVQAAEDAVNTIDNSNVSAAAAILVSKLAAGSSGDMLQTVAGVPTWGALGAFTTYTPTWTGGSPAIGNGTLTGRYVQIGKMVQGYVRMVAGSTTTFGSGSYGFSLPVTAVFTDYIGIGTASILDASPFNLYGAFVRLNSTTEVQIDTVASPAVQVNSTVPITFAVNDAIRFHFIYEAA